jgi:hypothetical protein
VWQIVALNNLTGQAVSFSDGQPMDAQRGGNGSSYRMVVNAFGFLDFTEVLYPLSQHFGFGTLDANGARLSYVAPVAQLALTLQPNGAFLVSLVGGPPSSGTLKPLPQVSPADAQTLDQMMALKIVPYQNIPDAPGKSTEEIARLGLQFFPFSPYSFQLAMSIYDWTTADFARMVFYKIFAYTSIPQFPVPLDLPSIANAIWTSNWPPYVPQNADYMNSFMMTPANSYQEVLNQLEGNYEQVHFFNEAENRLLTAAFASMPRTSLIAEPLLYSGQVDIQNLGSQHFAPEFLQFPLNGGPVGVPLEMPLAQALDTFIVPGALLTTKMVWSFGSSMAEAMEYQNGIILIAQPPPTSLVWDAVSYITPLSDDPAKIEYTFAPGTSFLVKNVEPQTINGKPVTVITLEPQTPLPGFAAEPE